MYICTLPHSSEDLRQQASGVPYLPVKKARALVKQSHIMEFGEIDITENAENKHVFVTSKGTEMGWDRGSNVGRT